MPFSWTVRIYYEDTDAAGIVYHANYLRFCERARTEWLRGHGFHQGQLSREWHVAFVLAATEVKFLRPARLDDELRVSVQPTRIGRASLIFSQQVLRADNKTLLVQLGARVGCIDARSSRPRAIPGEILEELRI